MYLFVLLMVQNFFGFTEEGRRRVLEKVLHIMGQMTGDVISTKIKD